MNIYAVLLSGYELNYLDMVVANSFEDASYKAYANLKKRLAGTDMNGDTFSGVLSVKRSVDGIIKEAHMEEKNKKNILMRKIISERDTLSFIKKEKNFSKAEVKYIKNKLKNHEK